MATLAANVRVGVTGGAYHAPTASTLPTDATTARDVTFKDVGYISDDGVSQTINSDTTEIKAWQNGDTVRKIQTSHDVSFQFTMIETNAETLKIFYADPTATATAVKVKGDQSPHEAWVLEVLDGLQTIRIVLPDAQVTDRGDVVYKTDEAIGYEVTLTAYPDTTGTKAYIYLDDGVA